MASISLGLLRQSSGNAIRVRISHNHTSAFINTGIIVLEKDFENNLQSPVKPSDNLFMRKNLLISEFVHKFNCALFEVSSSIGLDQASANDIRDIMLGKRVGKNEVLFSERMSAYGSTRNARSSISNYEYSCRKVMEFIPSRYEKFRMADIDYSFLCDFEKFLTDQHLKITTRAHIFRNIKAAYNDAVNRGLIDVPENPFKKFKIKNKKNNNEDIQFLHIADIQRMLSMDFSGIKCRVKLERARDIFMISMYLCGMNLTDIYDLEPQPRNEVVYSRNKLEHLDPPKCHIEKLPELVVLIDKYKGEKHLFNFCERDGRYDTFQRNVARSFEIMSEILGVKVNMAICRHTWASLCHRNGVDRYVISKGLGHIESDITSIYYSNFDWSLVSRANKDLADKIHKNVEKNSIRVVGDAKNFYILK